MVRELYALMLIQCRGPPGPFILDLFLRKFFQYGNLSRKTKCLLAESMLKRSWSSLIISDCELINAQIVCAGEMLLKQQNERFANLFPIK